jgi:stage V sporulation protein SpoVS
LYPHPQQQQQWPSDDAASGSASEASFAHTYPPTPVPSTPLGSRSSVAGSAFGGRAGGRSRGDTVTVSAASSVKDAAGAVAKVLERQGSCLLVALKRAGEGGPCGATHVAAKTLAVSRFYVNARMGAAGAAGGAAARALVAAAEGRSGGAAAAVASDDGAASTLGKEEVTFVPFQRSGRPQDADSLGFVVFKVKADNLPMDLPPPVGQPSALAAARGDQQQQPSAEGDQHQQQQQQQEPPLLKAGAGTDVNKLSNAVIRNVLEWGRVSLQLAGPAACHAAMQALAKARARLAKKFSVSIAVASAFSTEDTSGALGRATVFYRLDVLRVIGAAAEAAAAGWSAAGLLGSDADGCTLSVPGDGASSCGGW